MIYQSEAKIYLAEKRIRSGSGNGFISSMGKNRNDFKTPVLCFKDEVLDACKVSKINITENTGLLLLPIAGTIILRIENTQDVFLEPGQAYYISPGKDQHIELVNPYEEDAINCLEIWFRLNNPGFTCKMATASFDFEKDKNKLVRLFADNPEMKFFIGCFDGRAEALYKVPESAMDIFVFVINGAFEVQYRLLESRDALALWNSGDVDMEALSNNAIILLAHEAFI
jgi:hypothetical protein